jgi:hypothetical protein
MAARWFGFELEEMKRSESLGGGYEGDLAAARDLHCLSLGQTSKMFARFCCQLSACCSRRSSDPFMFIKPRLQKRDLKTARGCVAPCGFACMGLWT